MDIFELEQTVWTEKDFHTMGWHDCTIWSILANANDYEYLLDLDYIFKWVCPDTTNKIIGFWIAPVTMVFEHVFNIKVDISSSQGCIEISDLHMKNPRPTPNGKLIQHDYIFECSEGDISLVATGFKMFVRKPPQFIHGQSFELSERNGVSFGREYNDL